MNRKIHTLHSRAFRLATLLMLLIMAALQVGRSVHIYKHSPHACACSCEHSQEGERGHSQEDCPICQFEFSIVDRVEGSILTCSVVLISIIEAVDVLESIRPRIFLRTSRAPPYTL